MAAADERIVAVLVTGGVGAGKSLCVDALLRSLPVGASAAVCVHAFALSRGLETTAIDRSRVALYDTVYDCGGGRVCCSPGGDFTRFLNRAAHTPGVTHLLVETTGVAEPLAFAKLFYADAFCAQRFRLAAVLHVLDSGAPALPRRSFDDAAAPAWAAAATGQLSAASLVCMNLRADLAPEPASPEADETAEARHSESGPQLGASMSAGVDASVELVSGAAGAGADLASVVLNATNQLASVTMDGASSIFSGAMSSMSSLATLNVGGTADGLGRVGSAGLATVSSSAGVLFGAATEFGALGITRANDVGRRALLGMGNVGSAVLDDAIGLPAQAAGAVGDASRASFSFAHTFVSAAAAGIMASHGFVSDLLRGAPPDVARVLASLEPGESSAAAGTLLWEAIAVDGAFRPETAVALDPDFMTPPVAADAVSSPPSVPTVPGGYAARVTCVCAAEAGTPLIEARLHSWLKELAGSSRAVRLKGLVWVRTDAADAEPRLLMVDGLRECVTFRELRAHAGSRAGSEAVPALCDDAACELGEHTASAASLTSKLFMLVEPGESAALLKKAFRECFMPPGFAWAGSLDDFPPPASAGEASTRGIERQLQDGPAVVVWRLGSSRFYACEAHCPHAGASLAEGTVLDMEDAASTTLGPLLSCALHYFTWDLASGQPVSAVGCGALKTYDTCVVLRALYVCKEPQTQHAATAAAALSGGHEERDGGYARRPSWRQIAIADDSA